MSEVFRMIDKCELGVENVSIRIELESIVKVKQDLGEVSATLQVFCAQIDVQARAQIGYGMAEVIANYQLIYDLIQSWAIATVNLYRTITTTRIVFYSQSFNPHGLLLAT